MAFVTNNELLAKIGEGVTAVDAKKVTFWTRTGDLAQVIYAVLPYCLRNFDHIVLDLFFWGGGGGRGWEEWGREKGHRQKTTLQVRK